MNQPIKTLEQLINKSLNPNFEDLDQLLSYMLSNIGNPDPYIRDTLIYSCLCELILNDHLTDSQLIFIAETCCDDAHLYYNVNEPKSDAVLTRSFSALAIQLVLHKDQSERFLPQSLAIQILTKSIDYLKFEHDYRGYIENKGWAHSVAHGSDLLARAVSHPLFDEVSSTDTVLTIVQKCLQTDYAYIDEEDERMMPIFDALCEKGLSDDSLKHWLQKLQQSRHEDDLKHYRMHWNIKKFMYTLYAHCVRNGKYEQTTKWIYSEYICAK